MLISFALHSLRLLFRHSGSCYSNTWWNFYDSMIYSWDGSGFGKVQYTFINNCVVYSRSFTFRSSRESSGKRNFVETKFTKGRFLSQNNKAPVHKARFIQKRFAGSVVREIDWNLAEFLRDELERQVWDRPHRPTSVPDLTDALVSERGRSLDPCFKIERRSFYRRMEAKAGINYHGKWMFYASFMCVEFKHNFLW